MQPGQTIEPGQKPTDNQPPAELPSVEQPDNSRELKLDHQPTKEPPPIQAEQPQTPAQSPQPSEPNQTFTSQPRAEWASGPASEPPKAANQPADVQWTASEFIEHQKSSSWHMGVIAGGVVLAAVLYLITRDLVSVLVVIIAAILFSIIGSRKPRTLNYQINPDGITIAGKLYPFTDIKSFSVIEEGAINSIQLIPLKRFMPSLSVYYPPEQEEAIIGSLADYIPHEDHRGDPVDKLMKRLRF